MDIGFARANRAIAGDQAPGGILEYLYLGLQGAARVAEGPLATVAEQAQMAVTQVGLDMIGVLAGVAECQVAPAGAVVVYGGAFDEQAQGLPVDGPDGAQAHPGEGQDVGAYVLAIQGAAFQGQVGFEDLLLALPVLHVNAYLRLVQVKTQPIVHVQGQERRYMKGLGHGEWPGQITLYR
ncbi:hypothetical protein WR25_08741 [Diploscapter pachys]|uniref:Uncharacterized protein n=1 Tax=Diploscapter pachys TaxID=2018661 RepID=A0A2A2M567_9BILA|nr:hypothetical protein WR25_08741 [Diploscapter pachys]